MPKGIAIDVGRVGFGWSGRPPSLRLGFIAFYVLGNGIGVVFLNYKASLVVERRNFQR
ncbi:hypothetical protein J2D73_18650 [Acetobacter sacchari]|uniref:Uncharacterized protein n=1 Tax=Acetobacter sacchari TaxID=2661687 RepID=A0ABS3M0X1_9PROT|nr:hypothetical protein [Acetobacter sacchari]MBO1361806.1 hypothetical protein [Acetobacter sacchari]